MRKTLSLLTSLFALLIFSSCELVLGPQPDGTLLVRFGTGSSSGSRDFSGQIIDVPIVYSSVTITVSGAGMPTASRTVLGSEGSVSLLVPAGSARRLEIRAIPDWDATEAAQPPQSPPLPTYIRAFGGSAVTDVAPGKTVSVVVDIFPVEEEGDFVQVLAGYEWSLAVRSDGTVWGWGWLHTAEGTVDVQQNGRVLTPVRMYPGILEDVRQVAGGYDHFYALLGDGRVLHWGRANQGADGRGVDGNGSTSGTVPSPRYNNDPVEVLSGPGAPVDRVASIAASRGRLYMIRGVDAAGNPTSLSPGANRTVWVAGSFNSNDSNPFTVATYLPGPPVFGTAGYSPVRAVFAGTTSSGTPPGVIVLENGRAYGIGLNPYNGFGFPVGASPSYLGGSGGAVEIPGSWGTIRFAVFTFWYSLMAIRSDGTLAVSGYELGGEFGLGSTGRSIYHNGPLPVAAGTLSSVAAIEESTTLAVRSGRIIGWGSGRYGLLGPGMQDSNLPVDPGFDLDGVTQVSGGKWHALALGPEGIVYAWGSGYRGALGDGVDGNTRTQPEPVVFPPQY